MTALETAHLPQPDAPPQASRGSGRVRDIDAAPLLLSELARYFDGLTVDQLRTAWVACVADAVYDPAWEPGVMGSLCRALVVVAKRLHRVNIDAAVLEGHQPMNHPASKPLTMSPHVSGGPRIAGDPAPAHQRITSGDGFKVLTGLPNRLKSGRGGTDSLQLAIIGLKEGEHLAIDKGRFTLAALRQRVSKAKHAGAHPKLRASECTDGSLIAWVDPTLKPRASKR